jgi:hypothetical protein
VKDARLLTWHCSDDEWSQKRKIEEKKISKECVSVINAQNSYALTRAALPLIRMLLEDNFWIEVRLHWSYKDSHSRIYDSISWTTVSLFNIDMFIDRADQVFRINILFRYCPWAIPSLWVIKSSVHFHWRCSWGSQQPRTLARGSSLLPRYILRTKPIHGLKNK